MCSHPQTWARNFPAIFWLIVMSWCAVLIDCGHFSWLRSEPCLLSPVALGDNWYILLQPQTKSSSKPWCNGLKCHHQQLYPPHRCSFHIHHHMLIYFIPPPCKQHKHECNNNKATLIPGTWTNNKLMHGKDAAATAVAPVATVASLTIFSPNGSQEWLLAIVAHVKATVRPSKSMNKKRRIPLPLEKLTHCFG